MKANVDLNTGMNFQSREKTCRRLCGSQNRMAGTRISQMCVSSFKCFRHNDRKRLAIHGCWDEWLWHSLHVEKSNWGVNCIHASLLMIKEQFWHEHAISIYKVYRSCANVSELITSHSFKCIAATTSLQSRSSCPYHSPSSSCRTRTCYVVHCIRNWANTGNLFYGTALPKKPPLSSLQHLQALHRQVCEKPIGMKPEHKTMNTRGLAQKREKDHRRIPLLRKCECLPLPDIRKSRIREDPQNHSVHASKKARSLRS